MPVSVAKDSSGKYRIVENQTTKEGKTNHALVTRGGSPVDGGGHASKAKALAQARAINASLRKKGKT